MKCSWRSRNLWPLLNFFRRNSNQACYHFSGRGSQCVFHRHQLWRWISMQNPFHIFISDNKGSCIREVMNPGWSIAPKTPSALEFKAEQRQATASRTRCHHLGGSALMGHYFISKNSLSNSYSGWPSFEDMWYITIYHNYHSLLHCCLIEVCSRRHIEGIHFRFLCTIMTDFKQPTQYFLFCNWEKGENTKVRIFFSLGF